MNQYNFKINGENVVRINRKKAKTLYNRGISICLAPCLMNLHSMWYHPIWINNDSDIDFDDHVYSFEYCNCNNELGKYAAFYIKM